MKNVRVKRLVETPVKNGLGLAGSQEVPEDPRYIRITDIGPDGRLRADRFASQPRHVIGDATVHPGDVLVASVGATVGKSYLHVDQGDYCFAGYLSRIRPRRSIVDPRFLSYWTHSKHYWDQVRSHVVASTIENLSASRIGSFHMPLPSLSQQESIADYLDHETAEIDAFVEDLENLVRLEEERRVAALDRRIFEGSPPLIALKHVGTLRSGLTLGATYSEPVHEYPYLRVANVQSGHIDLSHVATVQVPSRVAEANRLHPGDVLMTEGGDRDKLGRGAIWRGEVPEALHQNHIFSFRCGEDLIPEYLAMVLESTWARDYFDLTARQSTNLASTNSTTVKAFRIPGRDLPSQQAVVEELNRTWAEISIAIESSQRAIELAQERRSALVSAAVTGKFDVMAGGKPVVDQLEDEIREKR